MNASGEQLEVSTRALFEMYLQQVRDLYESASPGGKLGIVKLLATMKVSMA